MKSTLPLVALLMASCATSHVMVGTARPPSQASTVRVYRTAPQTFQEIAFVHADGAWGKPGFQGSLDTAIGRLKERSAELGANGVILEPVLENARKPGTPVSGVAIWVP